MTIDECERITENPPAAPDGFELVECNATPRHWPIYAAMVDGMYPAPCYLCLIAEADRLRRQDECRREHRRWKSWRARGWLALRLYTLGIVSSGGGLTYATCEWCSNTTQYHPLRWRGRRPYILGLQREWWTCLLGRGANRRPHIPGRHERYGVWCGRCLPCPDCGATEWMHDCPVRPADA